MAVLNLQTIRYINLLDETARVKTSKCFTYNNTIIFAVRGDLLSKAIGQQGMNIKRLQDRLGKRVRMIQEAKSLEDAGKFVRDIVSPVYFRSIEARDNEIIITAGGIQSKAALIGRDKKRLEELSQILEDTFGMKLRVV